jgi:phage tail sheath protein FI
MVFQSSPGVNVTEIDLTTVVPGVATSVGALAGVFRWGPVNERTLIDSENALAKRFGKPTNFNAETFFTGANFLAYTNALQVVRAANTGGTSPTVTGNVVAGNTNIEVNSTAEISNGMILIGTSTDGVVVLNSTVTVSPSSTPTLVLNTASAALTTATGITLQFISPDTAYNAFVNTASVANLTVQNISNVTEFNNKLDNADFDNDVKFIAKWPGLLGNSLKISICDSAEAYSSNVDLTSNGVYSGSINFTVDSNTATISLGPNSSLSDFNVNTFNTFKTTVLSKLTVGDYVTSGNSSVGTQNIKLTAIGSAANIGLNANSGTTIAVTSASPNVVATSDAFTGLTNGQYIAVFSNSSVYRTLKILEVVDTNNVVLSTNAGFTNSASTWAQLNAASRSISLNLEDKYKRSMNSSLNTIERNWEYQDTFDTAPGQSPYVYANGNTAASDEMHIVVVDAGGKFTGRPGSILEKFNGVSRVDGAKTEDNLDNYYRRVLNSRSEYVWNVNDISGAPTSEADDVTNSTNTKPNSFVFGYGRDGADEATVSIGVITNAYDQFLSTDDVDVGLILQGKARGGSSGGQLANYLIDNIAEPRMDSVVFVSPTYNSVVNNNGREALDIIEFRNTLRSSSYGFLDSGYKYMYDKYNNLYRYVPLNGDIAGLAARTDTTNDAWWSFAGLNRGNIKNIIKLAWNPRKADRDLIYKSGINPVVTFTGTGEGTVLFGDKTLLAKPSAFDRINVRRLFIVLEKAIAKASKYTLFDFNDAFTRSQFRNLVIPFLRDVQGKRGINNFLVVCDNTNNTASVIDRNEFVADIYIQANRSINFIQLNFINTPNGVAFSEIVGQWG